MSTRDEHIRYLKMAETQFRLAITVSAWISTQQKPIGKLLGWSFGPHVILDEEIALSDEEVALATVAMERSATFCLAVHIRKAFQDVLPKARDHADSEIRAAHEISRLIRNAFSHNPGDPTWSIDPNCRNRVFDVKDIITLDTAPLDGKRLNWPDYGGPLALFRLSQFVRRRVLGDMPA